VRDAEGAVVDARVVDGGRALEMWSEQNGARVKNVVPLPPMTVRNATTVRKLAAKYPPRT
jgi:hypothetical protein